MLEYVKLIFKWVFRRETLENGLFAINVVRVLFAHNGRGDTKKAQSLIRKLDIAQKHIDSIQKLLPNDNTKKHAEKIDKDNKVFGDFSAKVVKDKHGKGNDGIDLNIKTSLLGMDVDLGYSPSNGGANLKLGPFDLNF